MLSDEGKYGEWSGLVIRPLVRDGSDAIGERKQDRVYLMLDPAGRVRLAEMHS